MAPTHSNDQDSLIEALRPDRTAVLVHDMQHDFCSPGGTIYNRAAKHPETIAAVVGELARFIEAARGSGVKIIYLQQMHLANAADIPPAHVEHLKSSGLAGTIDDIPCIKGTWGHQILDELAPEPHDIIVDKAAFNDFHNSLLDKVLRVQGIETPILTGVSSHAGVLGTFFGFLDHGYDFFMARECITGYDPELHEAAMAVMRPHTLGVAEIIAAWRGTAR